MIAAAVFLDELQGLSEYLGVSPVDPSYPAVLQDNPYPGSEDSIFPLLDSPEPSVTLRIDADYWVRMGSTV